MEIINLSVFRGNRSAPMQFRVKRMVNAGYVGRDRRAVEAHIEELRKEGVPPPPSVPMVFPVLSHNITTSDQIEVIGSRTSGEAEFVLLLDDKDVFVGVGSDHTDRELESHSIIKSKQVCKNVLSSTVWHYEDVKSDWDNLLIQSWVRQEESDEDLLYQRARLEAIISADEIMDLVKLRMTDDEIDGLVIYSGTVPILTDEIIYGSYFRSELIDSRSNRTLSCEYRIRELEYLKDMSSSLS